MSQYRFAKYFEENQNSLKSCLDSKIGDKIKYNTK